MAKRKFTLEEKHDLDLYPVETNRLFACLKSNRKNVIRYKYDSSYVTYPLLLSNYSDYKVTLLLLQGELPK